jgi:putative tryptophan/tyrosine transport system substrate-binding protein
MNSRHTATPVSEMAGPEPVQHAFRAFVQGLRALGYVEGQNLILERRSVEGRYERSGDIVAELVHLKADVIVTGGNPTARAAKAVTTTVPIVAAAVNDPVGDGLVQSLGRPGGNITGLTIRVGPEIEGQAPGAPERDATPESLASPTSPARKTKTGRPHGERACGPRRLGVTLVPTEHTTRQYTDAFTAISRARGEALSLGLVQWPTLIGLLSWASRPRLACQASSPFGSRWNSGVCCLMA